MTITHYDLELSDPRYDEESPEGPRTSLFLCTTPRSGSHRFYRALYDIGAGVPGEYFHPDALAMAAERWSIAVNLATGEGIAEYWRLVRRRRARNGIIGTSLFGFHLPVLRRLLELGDRPVFIHLRRRRLSDQVASLLALYQTKMPYAAGDVVSNIPGISEVSPRSIRLLGQWIAMQNRKWTDFLRDKPHIAVFSEDFFADPGKILAAVVEQGRLSIPAGAVEAAAAGILGAGGYAVNADIKRRMLGDFGDDFAALDRL